MFPTLVEIGPLTFRSYGLMLAIGAGIGIWRASRVSGRAGLRPAQIVDAGIVIVLFGLVGARLAYVLLNWRDFAGDPAAIIATWDGGLTFYGGLITGFAAGLIWCARSGVGPYRLADLLAPSLALSYGIARVGCFLNGCCYGCETDVPWAFRFHRDGGAALTPPSHPVQLYSAAISIGIFWVLTRLERRGLPPGRVFASWLVLSGLERFFLEHFRRGATAEVMWGYLTQAQVASLVLIVAGGLFIGWPRKHLEAHA